MDKLEIDARLAKVERSVSRLWMLGVALPAFLLLFVGTVLVAVPAVRGREEMTTATVYIPPPTPAPVAGPTDPWAVEDLACELGKVNDLMNEAIILMNEAIISTPQRDAKKAQLLGRPVRSGDLRDDLTKVQSMQASGVLSPPEAERLKDVILKGER